MLLATVIYLLRYLKYFKNGIKNNLSRVSKLIFCQKAFLNAKFKLIAKFFSYYIKCSKKKNGHKKLVVLAVLDTIKESAIKTCHN